MSAAGGQFGESGAQFPSNGGANSRHQNIGGRVAKLEAEINHLATKEDIQKLKVWWLGGIIAGMGLAAAIALGVLKIFLPGSS